MIEFIVIFCLIFCNAVFVASEFASVSVPRAAIELLANEGNLSARLILAVLKDPRLQDRYIAASQVGITAASLGLGMYGEHVIASWILHFIKTVGPWELVGAHAFASSIAMILLTYLHIVFGEMIPKSLALQRSESVMLLLVGPMFFFMRAFHPIIVILNGLNNLLLRKVLGIDRDKAMIAAFSPEEIHYIVKESETEGIISDEIGTVIEQVFDFGELKAEDIMLPRVHMTAIPVHIDQTSLLDIIKTSPHSRYPVYGVDKDDILGVVNIKELSLALESDRPVSMAVRPVPFLPLSAPIQTVLESMRDQSAQLAVVLDEFGGTAGIISVQDVYAELLGEIDESLRPPSLNMIADGVLEADGTVRLSELTELLGVMLVESEIKTLSGLVLDQLARPPRPGDTISIGALSIEVASVRGRGVRRCLVKRIL